MADVQPLRALHYDLARSGALGDLVAPPYDVIDAEQRAALAARSPYNVVEIDLPEGGDDPYAHAAELLRRGRREGALVRDDEPAIWALTPGLHRRPTAAARTRHGFFAARARRGLRRRAASARTSARTPARRRTACA